MRGFGPFLMGCIFGGVAVFASLSYHFVQTKDGVEMIPKLTPTFTETYVDCRAFGPTDWAQHKQLTAAITQANKFEKVIGGQAVHQIQDAAQGFVDQFGRAPANPQR
ncbi:MAG: hypothetical protein K8U03_10900 [Planctomycetia bacterium]|nr:hypothetical protein [Planctomycetia bacterium]